MTRAELVEVDLLAAEVAILEERLSVLERRLEAHHAIAATTEDVLSYHDPRRCPICEVDP